MLVLLLKKFSTPHFPGRRVAREMFEQKNNCVIACGSPEMNMFLPTDQQQCGFSNSRQHFNIYLFKPVLLFYRMKAERKLSDKQS